MLNKLKRMLKRKISYFRCPTPLNVEFKTSILGKNINHDIEKTISIPKILWIYWESEKIESPTVQICIETIKTLHPDYVLNILNKHTIGKYIFDDFNFIFQSKLPIANMSDWIRLKLLQLYGGIYIDASVLLLENLDWLLLLNQTHKTEAVVYYTEINTVDPSFPIIETWLIGAVPNANFISDWLFEYESCLNSPDPDLYYTHSKLFDYSLIPLDVAYYKCYFSAQTVLRSNDYSLTLICADTDAYVYSLQVKSQWSNIALSEILLLNKKPILLPRLVKIIAGSRRTLDENIAIGNYSPYSVLGELIFKTKRNEIC